MQNVFFAIKVADIKLRKDVPGPQSLFPSLSLVVAIPFFRQQKAIIIILCCERLRDMICLLVRPNIIATVVKTTHAKQCGTAQVRARKHINYLEAAYRDAFAEVCSVADDKLIKGDRII